MSTTTKAMNVSLTPELENFARSLVEQGHYNSASEVVRTSLRLLKEREDRIKTLRGEIQKGLDSGPSVEMTREELTTMIQDHAATLRERVGQDQFPQSSGAKDSTA